MSNTSSRSLRILSLLQRRRLWPGTELADRLEVSERTLRRDIERLRDLGYPITGAPGIDGGYRFEAGAALPPLQFDDDEAIALAVALHSVAGTSGPAGSALAEAATGALAKIIPALPHDVRARAEALLAVSDIGTDRTAGVSSDPSMSVLGTTAQACRDTVRLKFAYTAGDGTATERYVEPYRLVAIGRRWYLVAFDIDRGDWRTFRLDRVNEPRPARTPFVPRPLPDDDPHRYVSQRIRDLTFVHRIVADVHMAPHDVTSGLGTWVTVTPTHSGSRVTFDADRLDWPLLQLASLGAPFSIVGPPELRATALHLARQLQLAAAGTADPSRADPVK